MSLEILLAENTAAIKELVAETKALRDLRTDAIEAVKGAAKPAAKAAAKAAPAAAAEPETPAAEPAAAKAAVPSIEDVNASIASYVGPEEISKEERVARSAKVAGIIKSVAPEGVEKINAAAVPEGKRDAFIRTMAKLLGEGNLVAVEEAADAEDDLLG